MLQYTCGLIRDVEEEIKASSPIPLSSYSLFNKVVEKINSLREQGVSINTTCKEL